MHTFKRKYFTMPFLTEGADAGGGQDTTPDNEPGEAPETGADEDSDEKGAGSKAKVLADLATERRKRQAAEARVREMEDAALSETDKARRDATEATTRASEAEALLMRYQAAEAAGLPLSAAKRLSGSTPEELAADAAAFLAEQKDTRPSMAPDPSQGRGRGVQQKGTVSAGRELYAELHPTK